MVYVFAGKRCLLRQDPNSGLSQAGPGAHFSGLWGGAAGPQRADSLPVPQARLLSEALRASLPMPLCWALGDLFSLSHVADPFRHVRSEDWGKQKRNLRERQRVRRIGLPRRDLGISSCLPPELRACLSAIPAAVTQGTPNRSQAAEGLGVLSAGRTHLIGAGSCVESCSSRESDTGVQLPFANCPAPTPGTGPLAAA